MFCKENAESSYREDEISPRVEEVNSPVNITNEIPITDWRALWGIIATNGPNKLTRKQYSSIRTLLDAMSSIDHLKRDSTEGNRDFSLTVTTQSNPLPHFSTLQRHFRPLLLQFLVPRIIYKVTDADMSKAGVRSSLFSGSTAPKCRVPIILPSEYARADMATGPVWLHMLSTSLQAHLGTPGFSASPAISLSNCVDIWPAIASREWFYGPRSALHLDADCSVDFSHSFAEVGDSLNVFFLNSCDDFPENLARCFGSAKRTDGRKALQGKLVHSWTVHHDRRRGQPQFVQQESTHLTNRDRELLQILGYASYVSPEDTISAESTGSREETREQGSESVKSRREAAKKRKNKYRQHGRHGRNPF